MAMNKSKKKKSKKLDWAPPLPLPTPEETIPTYDELVSQGMEFVKEDIAILGEQLEVLEDTSNQFLDCLHIASPDNGKLYDNHRKSTLLILDKIKNIQEIINYMQSNLKNTTQ
tara:strand:- start:1289 stop:1627 length:339 start_codon:yes stop_codon:yes gene_type:complete